MLIKIVYQGMLLEEQKQIKSDHVAKSWNNKSFPIHKSENLLGKIYFKHLFWKISSLGQFQNIYIVFNPKLILKFK